MKCFLVILQLQSSFSFLHFFPDLSQAGTYSIYFVPTLSPPATKPPPTERIYNVALGNKMTKSLIALLMLDGKPVTAAEDLAGLLFQVETVDVDVANNVPGATDTWTGTLCDWGSRYPGPNTLNHRLKKQVLTKLTDSV